MCGLFPSVALRSHALFQHCWCGFKKKKNVFGTACKDCFECLHGAWGRLTSSCNGIGKGKGKGRRTGEKLMQEPRQVRRVEAVRTEDGGFEGFVKAELKMSVPGYRCKNGPGELSPTGAGVLTGDGGGSDLGEKMKCLFLV